MSMYAKQILEQMHEIRAAVEESGSVEDLIGNLLKMVPIFEESGVHTLSQSYEDAMYEYRSLVAQYDLSNIEGLPRAFY